MFSFRKSAAMVLTTVLAATTLMSASAASTTKALSSNFTLVNLVSGTNNIQINYIKSNGTQWRAPENVPVTGFGAQVIRRQYDPNSGLSAGSGSVVVSSDGPVGAVVQILTLSGPSTYGDYDGVSQGAQQANVPLVQRKRNTASGISNSQVIVQNASNTTTDIDIDIINNAGTKIFTKHFTQVAANVSVTYDLADEDASNIPDNFFGSAIVKATTTGGQVAVVSNLFNGADTMQTFNTFTASKSKWGIPLFAIRLANKFNTPVAVQNTGTTPIPVDGVTMNCTKDAAAPGAQTLTFKNTTAIGPTQSYFFNPVTDQSMPALWFGACNIDAGSAQTAVFVQLRFADANDPGANLPRADAHEGIPLDGTDKVVTVPLWAKRLGNGFASAITILNLSTTQATNVTLDYKAGDGARAECHANFSKPIAAGGSLIQNQRLATVGDPTKDNPNSVPQLPADCFGTLTVTSDNTPINAFVQFDKLDDILPQQGDVFQAQNAFTVASTTN
jgi:hypothetical protein